MSTPSEEDKKLSYRCPVCHEKIASHLVPPDTCPDCGYFLWCRSKIADNADILDVLTDRTPEQADIQRLADSLAESRDVPRVVVDLSSLDRVTSLLMAKLLVLDRRMRCAEGALVLCGMQPVVRLAFVSTKLDTVFKIADDEDKALAGLLSEDPA